MLAVIKDDLKEWYNYHFTLIVVAFLMALAVTMFHDIFLSEFFYSTGHFIVGGHSASAEK